MSSSKTLPQSEIIEDVSAWEPLLKAQSWALLQAVLLIASTLARIVFSAQYQPAFAQLSVPVCRSLTSLQNQQTFPLKKRSSSWCGGFSGFALNLLIIPFALSKEPMQMQLRTVHCGGINLLCSQAETESGISSALCFKKKTSPPLPQSSGL